MLEIAPQLALNGIVVGATIALGSLGLTLIWGIEGFPNIAQGDMLTLGAFLTYALNAQAGMPLLLAGTLSVLLSAALVLAGYNVALRPLRESRIALFVASIGLALAMRGLISFIWGTQFHTYRLPAMRNISLGVVRVNPVDIAVVATAAAVMALLYLVVYRTRIGIEMRAVADVPDLARVSGVNSRRVLQVTWLLAGLVTAAAGTLLGAKINVHPLLGWHLLLAMFAATTLGGIGSLPGAVVGGIALGLVMELSTVWISSTYKVAVAFIFLALVLLLRPRGLFAK